MSKLPSNARQIHIETTCTNCNKVVSRDGVPLVVYVVTPAGCICHTCAKMLNFSNQPLKLDDEREN